MGNNELKELAERLRESGMPTHFEEGKARLLLTVWRLVAQGQPVTKNEIKETAQSLGGSVEDSLSFIDQISERDDEGNVVGIFGLSQREHPHKFILGAQAFSTWCAWDALFLPPMLKQKARIESNCPQTKDKIVIVLGPEGVESFTPTEAVLSIILPESSKTGYESVEQVWSSFCCNVHFFMSETAAKRWLASKNVNFELLSVEEGFQLGLQTFREILQYV